MPSPSQFLCYKTLKKCLKAIPEHKTNEDGIIRPGEKRKLTDEQRLFLKTLNAELQKFNRFFISAEEDFVMKETKLEAAYRQASIDLSVHFTTGCPASLTAVGVSRLMGTGPIAHKV